MYNKIKLQSNFNETIKIIFKWSNNYIVPSKCMYYNIYLFKHLNLQ